LIDILSKQKVVPAEIVPITYKINVILLKTLENRNNWITQIEQILIFCI